MDFDWNCLLGKLQQPQLVCTPRSSRCKIRSSRNTVCANDIQRFHRVMQGQHNVQYMELLDKKLAGPGPEMSVHPGVTLILFFSFFFVTFFLTENLEAACFTEEHPT